MTAVWSSRVWNSWSNRILEDRVLELGERFSPALEMPILGEHSSGLRTRAVQSEIEKARPFALGKGSILTEMSLSIQEHNCSSEILRNE